LLNADVKVALEEAIRQLPEKYRAVFIIREREDKKKIIKHAWRSAEFVWPPGNIITIFVTVKSISAIIFAF
jgi:hypothetical protein